MSYYSEINFTEPEAATLSEKTKFSSDNEPSMTSSEMLLSSLGKDQVKPKQKFIEKESPNDFWLSKEKSEQTLDIESKLKKSQISTKYKMDIQPTQNIEQNIANNKSMSAGRGFGNLNISNDIRYGGSSRMDTKEFKEKRESRQMLDFHFQYLDKDYQNPNNIVMPIPRGGDMTRKQKSTTNDNISGRNDNISGRNHTIDSIKFDYS